LIIFDVDAHVSRTLVFVSPMNAFGCIDNVALWQVSTIPTRHLPITYNYSISGNFNTCYSLINGYKYTMTFLDVKFLPKNY
jgi:hypothetical protein